jgi:hypothetical protein
MSAKDMNDSFDLDRFKKDCRAIHAKWNKTIQEIADVSDISYTTVQNMLGVKRAKEPGTFSMRSIVRLAVYFDLSLDGYVKEWS